MSNIGRFNSLGAEEVLATLLSCCGSRAWAQAVAAGRSYGSGEQLLAAASEVWFALAEPDWLEAFACHPRIGEVKSPATTFLTHSTAEQSAAQATIAQVATRLVEGNHAYEARFGFLYLVFASGRTAPELLAVLEQRLGNTRAEELQEAARQQDHITRLRLERWLAQ